MSQQYSSSPAMASGMSRSTSARSAKAMPFVARGPVAPLQTSSSTPATSSFDQLYQSKTEPPTPSLFASNMQQQQLPRTRVELARVEENCSYPDVGMNPMDFLAACEDSFASAPLAPLPQNYPPAYSGDARHSNASYMTSGCPSMVSGTSAAETMPLTRENSSFDSQLASAIGMARIGSAQSQRTDFTDDNFYTLSQDMCDDKHDELFAFAGADLSAPTSQQYGSLPMEHSVSYTSVGMERSISASSSQSSIERRAREARQRQIQNARKANLMPKPIAAPSAVSQPTKTEGKVPVSKTGTYTRPKHPKVKCDLCDEHPDGFRGEHELKRHMSAKHNGTVKKYVCRDPATVGIHSDVEAQHPLSKCKQCMNGKQYGAYYNAAAHLRRTHFKPKTPRNKHKKGEEEEKRGGKGGGDWPSMNELKNWFEEITVSVSQGTPDGGDDEEDGMDVFGESGSWDASFTGLSATADAPFMAPDDFSAVLPNLDMTTKGEAGIHMTSGSFAAPSGTMYDFSPFAPSPMAGVSCEGNFATVPSTTGAVPDNFQSFDDMYTPFPLESF